MTCLLCAELFLTSVESPFNYKAKIHFPGFLMNPFALMILPILMRLALKHTPPCERWRGLVAL